MAMYLYEDFDSADVHASMSSGVSSLILDGDWTGTSWLEVDDVIKIVEGANDEDLTVTGTSYDPTPEETTVTFAETTSNAYTTAAQIYSLRNQVKKQEGFLEGDGSATSFDVNTEPSEVRSFKTGTSYGTLLTNSSETGENWEYNSSTGQVELGYTPVTGETVVAFGAGKWLFSEEFLSEGVNETEYQDVYLYIDTSYDCVYVEANEVISSEISAEWFSIGKEVATDTWDYESNTTFCGYDAGDVIHFRVKMFFPAGSDKQETVRNYYNTRLYLGHLTLPTN